MDCSCLQTAGESSVSRRLCHANCLKEGLAFDGRNSSKAPISRLSFFLFSDKSGNLLDSLSELSASSTGCCPIGSGLRQLDADAILRSRFHHRKALTDANPRVRTYNLL